jgi:predicted ATPase
MIQTNWYVITGGPSSGKTTLINYLAQKGFFIAPEIARDYIENLLANNYTLDDLYLKTKQLQRTILALALKRERHLQAEQLILFDRGTIDSLGYFAYYHLDTTKIQHSCQNWHYKKIFYCHQLPLVNDKIRIEDNNAAKKIGELIHKSYVSLGYELIELPAVSIDERMDIILKHLQIDRKI